METQIHPKGNGPGDQRCVPRGGKSWLVCLGKLKGWPAEEEGHAMPVASDGGTKIHKESLEETDFRLPKRRTS